MPPQDDTTHFGYRKVPTGEKATLVKGVFDSVASRYDVMNDLMSFGIHRLWKRFTIEQTGLRPGDRALDVAGGTGELRLGMAGKVGPDGQVVLTDINAAMLTNGRRALLDSGITGNVTFAQVNAEQLPFPENSFDLVTIAFGLRNVTDKQRALDSICRVLKPGGRLLVLEFSKPVMPGLDKAYDFYSFNVLPKMGKLIANDEDSYRYLAESIRKHPPQDELAAMMRKAGFADVAYRNLTGGIVAIHSGTRD